MEAVDSDYDFSHVHASLDKYVQDDLLAMAAAVVLDGQAVVDFHMVGHQDREKERLIQADSIYRIYSSTKLITSCAAMMLWEEGKFGLDDPLHAYLPELGSLKVLKDGAGDAGSTEPVKSEPTVRQLMCHNAGFSYGIFAESVVDPLYNGAGVSAPTSTLEDMVRKLADIPLAYQPGQRWQYSVSADVLGRLIEVLSGQRFGEFLSRRIFEPLGMLDTGFHVPAGQHDRFCANYAPVNMLDPMQPGLNVVPDTLVGDYLERKPMESGGGGLVSTLGDYTRFIQMIVGGGVIDDVRVLNRETLDMMRTNQLPEGVGVQLPNWYMPDTVFGLGFAVKTAPRPGEGEKAIGEYHWGGLAGTHSWMSPSSGISGIVFTQRLPGFWHPFSHDFKRLVYQATTQSRSEVGQ